MAHGALAAAYEPPYWTGAVVDRRRHRGDLAVLVIRTYLPYPYLSGQHAVVEVEGLPDEWRPCWLATPPASDNLLEVHVRAGARDSVGAALTGAVPGERVRLRPAEGPLVLDEPAGSCLLFVAEDTGVAPMRALLGERRQRRDPRPVHLFWLVNPNEEPYDLAAVRAYEDATTAVLPVASVPDLAAGLAARGPWSAADAYVAGTPTGVAAALTVLAYADVPAGRIRHDEIGPDD
jgi:NAD(P)H-flavin reductase